MPDAGIPPELPPHCPPRATTAAGVAPRDEDLCKRRHVFAPLTDVKQQSTRGCATRRFQQSSASMRCPEHLEDGRHERPVGLTTNSVHAKARRQWRDRLPGSRGARASWKLGYLTARRVH